MFGKRISLFKLFGFEVRMDASWLILGILVAWTLAKSYYPSAYKGLSSEQYWWMGIASAVGLFASIVVHEFAHSWVAKRNGLAMNGITLFIFGGVAEMSEEPPNARTELLMALAGPATSIVIGCLAYLLCVAARGTLPPAWIGTLRYLSFINLALAIFNLIPAFPLDGGRVLRAALWHWKGDLRRATAVASKMGAGFGFLLILLAIWRWFLGDLITAIWYFVIGLFLRGAAQASYQQMMIKMTLQGEPVRNFMNDHPVAVPSYISLEELVDKYIYRFHHKMFPVLDPTEKLAGCVTTAQVKAFPREEWARHSLQEVLEARSSQNTVGPNMDAAAALSQMVSSSRSRLMVAEEDHLVGILSLKDLLALLAAKADLGGGNFSPQRVTGH